MSATVPATAPEAATVPSAALRGGDRRFRLAGWVVMALVLAAALAVGVADDGGPRTVGERERDIAASVACPACDGQSVADSDATASRGVRTYIATRIGEGASDDEIRDELADRYGEQILLTPGRSGLAGLVWVLPVVALVLAFAGLALAFRRWRGRAVVSATEADRALVGEALAARRPPDVAYPDNLDDLSYPDGSAGSGDRDGSVGSGDRDGSAGSGGAS
ncbi:MAG TPA: cytochrome c-type biogenesis protein [Acidimicrobiales bacterium]|nr:cytochrome c-type biogenesis protein [Acidimicrobiales bacterium]